MRVVCIVHWCQVASDDTGHSLEQMQNMKMSLFSSFNQESSGGAGGAISSMLHGSLAIGGASESASGDYFSVASVLGGSALTDTEPGDMLPTPKKPSSGGGTMRRGAGPAASPNLADSSRPSPRVKIEQVDRSSTTKRPRAQSQQPAPRCCRKTTRTWPSRKRQHRRRQQ